VSAAIKWVEYTTQQALSINVEVCSPDALESNLAKIISLAERSGGKVTARDVIRGGFNSKYRPTSQRVREWFGDLEAMKYGKVTEEGRSICFSLQKTSALSAFAENPDGVSISNADDKRGESAFAAFSTQKYEITKINAEETRAKRGQNADDSRVLQSPVGKDLNSNAGKADVFTSSTETSQPSMLSCVTDLAEFAEQIRKAIADVDRSLAIKVWNALAGKAKTKLRNEVKDCLAPSETKNFKLFAKAGFLQGMRVKYVGDPKYAEQYEGLELEVYTMNEYFQIACRKPDGSFTTWLKPEELEIIS
jgi:hypothetical protein